MRLADSFIEPKGIYGSQFLNGAIVSEIYAPHEKNL